MLQGFGCFHLQVFDLPGVFRLFDCVCCGKGEVAGQGVGQVFSLRGGEVCGGGGEGGEDLSQGLLGIGALAPGVVARWLFLSGLV